jgi:hypothetical protein
VRSGEHKEPGVRKLTRVAIVVSAIVLVLGVSGEPALAKPATPSNWHVGVYNSSGRAFSNGQAANAPGALATFHFTTSADTALLTTSQGAQKGNLIGDIRGKQVTANFTITGSNDFQYYGQPDACGKPASVRLYFETSGKFAYTNFWWSNPAAQVLANGNNLTVTATVSGEQWSDWNGQFGTTEAAGFAAAAKNASAIGLSFGGGCFFENGVGASNADFTLNSYTLS